MSKNVSGATFLRFCANPVAVWTGVKIENGKVSLESGICKQIFDIVASKLKFRYDFVVPADKQWGKELPNGSYTGMIGLLQREEADVCIGPSSPSYARLKAVDFSNLYSMHHLSILSADAEEPSGNVFSCILNFDWKIWVVLMFALVVVSFLFTVMKVSEGRLSPGHSFFGTMLANVWNCFAALCLQGEGFMPSRVSGRILVGIWWFSVIIIMNSFSGGLKAGMVAKSPPDRIQSVQDLVERPHIRPITAIGTIYEDFIRESPQEVYKKLWNQILTHNGLLHPAKMFSLQIIQEIKEGKSVLIMDETFATIAVGKACAFLGKSNFYFSKETMFPHSFGMMFRKTLPKKIKKKINKVLRVLFEAGLMKTWWKHVHYSFEKCSRFNPTEREKPLYIDDVRGVFLMYGIILGASLLSILLEKKIKRNYPSVITSMKKRDPSQFKHEH